MTETERKHMERMAQGLELLRAENAKLTEQHRAALLLIDKIAGGPGRSGCTRDDEWTRHTMRICREYLEAK